MHKHKGTTTELNYEGWGYDSRKYAESLSEFGDPRLLSRSGGWVLERKIPTTEDCDATGCYPMFACRDWTGLVEDVAELASHLVAVSLVTDPFGDYTEALLRAAFPDLMGCFKHHYVVDLKSRFNTTIHPHHQRNARKALREIRVDQIEPYEALEDWNQLYDNLIKRHAIKGIARFSHHCFKMQLGVPGMKVFRAQHANETVAMTLWLSNERIAYYHLGAYSDLGYRLHASFAIFQTALNFFAEAGLQHADLGAGAGVTKSTTDGLSRFKRGWATSTRDAYLCGRILDPKRYDAIVAAKQVQATSYFPAYRIGEFG